MATSNNNLLGIFLKDRRARLDPITFGFDSARRRTPGLRREEVALRARVSAAWYTWLEQGRGGAPSAEVLERVANALLLTPAEREHMFLLALQRPPAVRHGEPEIVSSRLQRVLDAMEYSPALVKTSAWDIVAWNRAAQAVLADYAKLVPEQRNILRLIFTNADVRAKMSNWERDARAVVATFRLESMRGGSSDNARALVEELCQSSAEFAAMWHANDVQRYGQGTKHIHHPIAGPLALEYAAFAVDGQPDLGLVIYTPATPEDRERVKRLVA